MIYIHTLTYTCTHIYTQLFDHKVYNKIAFFPTIVISAMYHEYVLWAPMRFVVPILLTQFGVFGGVYTYIHTCTHHTPVHCIHTHSDTICIATVPKKYNVELLSTLVSAHGCLHNDLLLCNGVLCPQDLSNGREHCKYFCPKILQLLCKALQFLLTNWTIHTNID